MSAEAAPKANKQQQPGGKGGKQQQQSKTVGGGGAVAADKQGGKSSTAPTGGGGGGGATQPHKATTGGGAKPEGTTRNNNNNGKKNGNDRRENPNRPNTAERDAALAQIESEIAQLKKEQDAIQGKLNKAGEINKGSTDERNKLRAALNTVKEELNKVKQEKEAALLKQKIVLQGVEQARAEERKAKESCKFNTAEEIDAEVVRLEQKIQRERPPVVEEKKILREIEVLRNMKKMVASFKDKRQKVADEMEKKNEVDREVAGFNTQIGKISKRYGEARDALAALTNKPETEGLKVPELRSKRDEIRAKMDALYARKQQVHVEWKKTWDDFVVKEQERRKEYEEKKKQEEEEKRKVFEEKKKAKELEEASRKPWLEELATCDALISYLESRIPGGGGDDTSAAAVPSKKNNASSKKDLPQAMENLVLHVRDASPEITAGKKKPTPVEKKITKNSKDQALLLHPLLVQNFARIEVECPTLSSELATALQRVKDKRAYFDKLPRPAKSVTAASSNGDDGSSGNKQHDVGNGSVEGKKTTTTTTQDSPHQPSPPPGLSPAAQSSDVQFPSLPGMKATTGTTVGNSVTSVSLAPSSPGKPVVSQEQGSWATRSALVTAAPTSAASAAATSEMDDQDDE